MTTVMVLLMEVAGVLSLAKMGAAFAASIAVCGAAVGISRIGAQALDSLARQPETASDVRSNMIVSAALIEGLAFFAIIVAIIEMLIGRMGSDNK